MYENPPPPGTPPPVQWLPPPGAYGYAPPPRRSSTPTVVGVLMIIFASLGLVISLVVLNASGALISDGEVAALGDAGKRLREYNTIEQSIWVGVGLLHLVAGILCVTRKRVAPTVAIAYAIVKMMAVAAVFLLVYFWLDSALASAPAEVRTRMTMTLVMGSVFNLAWPIVVWALISRPAARAACDR
jgi:hypothetical protein